MALVKRSELTGKAPGRDSTAEEAQPVPAAVKVSLHKRREQNRSRARLEKAAERIGAATEEFAAGVREAASAAQELDRSLGQIATAAEEAAGAAQESQAAVDNLGAIFAQARDRAALSRRKTEGLQTLLLDVAAKIGGLAHSVQENSVRQRRAVELAGNLDLPSRMTPLSSCRPRKCSKISVML